MLKMDRPGIYDISHADYFRDPCPRPSFTASVAKTLLNRSPRHVWHEHARLNPKWEPDDDRKYDTGNLAHMMLLGKGKDFELIDATDYRTKIAQKARDEAIAQGKIPVLPKLMDKAVAMKEAAIKQMANNGIEWREEFGQSEVMVCCHRDGHWMRSLIDRLGNGVVYDYKTTAGDASPDIAAVKMVTDGWDVQAAVHETILLSLGEAPRHRFILQETAPPYALSVWIMGEAAMTIGRQKMERAWTKWLECLTTNQWPTYTTQAMPLMPPEWAVRQWEYARLSEPTTTKSATPIDG